MPVADIESAPSGGIAKIFDYQRGAKCPMD